MSVTCDYIFLFEGASKEMERRVTDLEDTLEVQLDHMTELQAAIIELRREFRDGVTALFLEPFVEGAGKGKGAVRQWQMGRDHGWADGFDDGLSKGWGKGFAEGLGKGQGRDAGKANGKAKDKDRRGRYLQAQRERSRSPLPLSQAEGDSDDST